METRLHRQGMVAFKLQENQEPEEASLPGARAGLLHPLARFHPHQPSPLFPPLLRRRRRFQSLYPGAWEARREERKEGGEGKATVKEGEE